MIPRTRPDPAAPTPPRAPELVLLLAILLGQAALTWSVRDFFTDDAWISLRYALRFAEGDGPVWNAGGPPVEGYSNPLLVGAEALVMRLGGDGWGFARALGVACAAATVVATWAGGRRLLGGGGGLLAAAMVGLSPAVAYWAVGGLETFAYTLPYTVAALLLAIDAGDARRPVRLAGACLALLPWLRPEGALLAVPLALASEALRILRPATRRAGIVRLGWLLAPVVLSSLALEGLRLGLYGHLVPNSVIYKSGTGDTGAVTLKFLEQAWPAIPFAAVGLVTLPGRARLLAVAPLVALAGSPFFRDSVNDFSRLLLPTWPGWALLTAGGVVSLARRAPASPVGALGLVSLPLLGALALVTPASVGKAAENAGAYASCRQEARAAAGDWLREHVAPGEAYAVADAGLIPYRADGAALDLFGLNEAALQDDGALPPAERARRMIELAPPWIVLTSESVTALAPRYATERHLTEQAGFSAYGPVAILPGKDCDYNLMIFRKGAPADPSTAPLTGPPAPGSGAGNPVTDPG